VATNTTGSTPSISIATTTTPASESTTTTSQFAAPAANATAPTAALPSSYGVSASDLLNEQMQLTYEIANLRLLLEGPLNDRVVQTKDRGAIVKPRATIGFPITIRPDKRYKSAVAVVEVTVSLCPECMNLSTGANEPIAITALLPREKTYNVAAITEHDTAIGAGIVTHAMVGASVAWGMTHQKYYVVQDQDTVALTFPPEETGATGFLWEFRPVLGRKYIPEGLKQTFVQLAFPEAPDNPNFAKVHIRTYWRKYDSSHGLVLGIVKDSLREDVIDWTVPRLTLPLSPSPFTVADLEDLANGKMRVTLNGHFLDGTSVRIGSTLLRDGTPGFVSNLFGITFDASINDLATKEVDIVARDGTPRRLLLSDDFDCTGDKLKDKHCTTAPLITSADVSVSAVDENNSVLTVKVENLKDYDEKHWTVPLVIVVGGHTFGYSDVPIQRSSDNSTLSALISTGFLSANRRVTVTPLLASERYQAAADVTALDLTSQPAHLALLETTDNMSRFLLYGNRLKNAKIISPDGAELCPIGRAQDEDSLQMLVIPAPK